MGWTELGNETAESELVQFSTDNTVTEPFSLPGSGGAAANRTVTKTDVVPILREPRGLGRCQERRNEQTAVPLCQKARKGRF